MLLSQAQLHIPDGFLTPFVSLIFWWVTIVMVGLAIAKTNKTLGEKQIPLMGVMAAFIFAAQMLISPSPGGPLDTSWGWIGRNRAGAVGRHPGDDRCGRCAGASVPGRRIAGDGGQYLQYGDTHSRDRFWFIPAVVNRSKGVRLTIAGVAAWLATMAAALLTSFNCGSAVPHNWPSLFRRCWGCMPSLVLVKP